MPEKLTCYYATWLKNCSIYLYYEDFVDYISNSLNICYFITTHNLNYRLVRIVPDNAESGYMHR